MSEITVCTPPDQSHYARFARASRIASFMLGLVAASLTFTLNGVASESELLNVGVLLPPEEPQLQSIRDGILLAEQHLNLGSNGPVHVSMRGRVGQWGADAVEAARLVDDEGAAGLIAPPGGAASHLVLQVSGRTAVPVVTLCADSSVEHTGVPWVLRVGPRTEDEAVCIFRGAFSTNSGRDRHWVAFVPNQRAGREIGNDLKRAALTCCCSLDRVVEVSSITNVEETLAHALSSRPEALLFWLPPRQAGALVKIVQGRGYTGPLAGPGPLQTAEFLESAGKAADGFAVAAIASIPDDRFTLFEVAYKERFGREADLMAALSYDAVMLFSDLLRRREFQDPPHRVPADYCWPGLTGQISFDSHGNRRVRLELLHVSSGRFVPVGQRN
ncbi:MAG TPA: ABC transporter substrate-binding protein [Patescibacteria group bacterium]|nr:ABC transporter substrate-binding protein [Patescibacteria group bacterium]